MSIFGKLDAANIPTNPYYIAEGEYQAEVTDAGYKTNRDGNRQLFIEYTITDENSEFHNKKASQYFTLPDADMDQEALDLLPPDEKKSILRTISAVKRTLSGNEMSQRQKGLGVDPEMLNDDNWDPSSLKGTKIDIGITNYGEKKEGVNIRWVNIKDENV